MISRQLGESSVQVSLPSDYLDSTFAAYGLKEKVGSNSPPDLGSYVERKPTELHSLRRAIKSSGLR